MSIVVHWSTGEVEKRAEATIYISGGSIEVEDGTELFIGPCSLTVKFPERITLYTYHNLERLELGLLEEETLVPLRD